MRKFFTNLRKSERGDQVVGWVILAALVALVGGALWGTIATDLNSIIAEVETTVGAAEACAVGGTC